MVDIPGFAKVKIEYIVCDYNGTVAKDGILLQEAAEIFETLSNSYKIHLITADTFGSVKSQTEGLPVALKILTSDNHTAEKREYLKSLGSDRCAALGNGNNDIEMLKEAKIGIAVIGAEGCAAGAIAASDIIFNNIKDALDLFIEPNRLKATLRR